MPYVQRNDAGNIVGVFALPQEGIPEEWQDEAELSPVPPSDKPQDNPLKRWQFKAMVSYLGKADAIVAAINAMEDPLTRAVVMARYENSDVYNREDPLFDQLAPAVGLTPKKIDAAWMTIINQSR